MTLDRLQKGQQFTIKSIPDEMIRAQVLRFGIIEGSGASVGEIVPAGPIILNKNKQEIAIGRGLARQIKVELSEGKQGIAN